jgi:hypothetical protein
MLRWLTIAFLVLLGGQAHAQPFGGAVYCNSSTFYDNNTNGVIRMITAAPTGGIYVCGFVMASEAAMSMQLVYGRTVSAACDTGQTALTPDWQFTNTGSIGPPIMDPSPAYRGMFVPPGNDLCVKTSTGSEGHDGGRLLCASVRWHRPAIRRRRPCCRR